MSEILDAVREKYPAYKDWPDDDLAFAIGNKYPAYRKNAEFDDEFKAASVGRSVKEAQKVTGTVVSTLEAGAEGSQMGREQLARQRELEAIPKTADQLAAQNFYARQAAGGTLPSEGVQRPRDEVPTYVTPAGQKEPIAVSPEIAEVDRHLRTREGGQPLLAYDKSREERLEEFKKGIQEPAVPLPKFGPSPKDSMPVAAAKEVANLLVGIPEFAETPMGIITLGLGGIGKGAQTAVRLAFAADMVRTMFSQSKEIRDNWNQMTTAEKTRAAVDVIGSGVMATALMHPELQANVKEPLKVLGDRTSVLAPDIVEIGGKKFAFEPKPLPGPLAVAGAGAVAQLPPPAQPPPETDVSKLFTEGLPPGAKPEVPGVTPPTGPISGRFLVTPEGAKPAAIQQELVAAAETAKSAGAPLTAAAIEQVAKTTPPAPEKGAPSALYPETAQPVRPMREEPGRGPGEVPPEGRRKEDDEGRREAPAAAQQIAKQIPNVRFEGVQKGQVPGQKDYWMWTTTTKEPGSTFMTEVGAAPEAVERRARIMDLAAEKGIKKFSEAEKLYDEQKAAAEAPAAPRPSAGLTPEESSDLNDLRILRKSGSKLSPANVARLAELEAKAAAAPPISPEVSPGKEVTKTGAEGEAEKPIPPGQQVLIEPERGKKPLPVQREQIRRLLADIEAKREIPGGPYDKPKLQARLGEIERQLLEEARAAAKPTEGLDRVRELRTEVDAQLAKWNESVYDVSEGGFESNVQMVQAAKDALGAGAFEKAMRTFAQEIDPAEQLDQGELVNVFSRLVVGKSPIVDRFAKRLPEGPKPAETVAETAQSKAISGETKAPPTRAEADKEAGRKLTDEEFAKVQQGHEEGVKNAEVTEKKLGETAIAQEPIEQPAIAPTAPPTVDITETKAEVKPETEDELRARAAAAERQPVEGTPGLDVGKPTGVPAPTVPTGEAGAAPRPEVPGGPKVGGKVEEGRPVREPSVGGGPGAGVEPVGRPSEQRPAAEAPAVAGAAPRPEPPPRREPVKPEDRNHVLPRDADWIPRGDKSKARANLDAIKLLKKLEAENRNPSPAEKEVLAKYVGWGGLKPVFDEGKAAYRPRKDYIYGRQLTEYENWEKNWGKIYDQVKAALTPEEWDSAAASILNAHYSSRTIINAIWDAIDHLGFTGGIALEPGTGIGNFIGLQPEPSRARTAWAAVEIDDLTSRMLKKLYPEAKVQAVGFEKARIPNNSVDLVTGNFPFDKSGPHDPRYPDFSLHNYFFARAMDALKPGGILAAITSDSTMDSPASKGARLFMAERADLIGAIRLPNNAFKENAGTEVTTDILFFRKRDGTPFNGERFMLTTAGETYKKEPIEINEYFDTHPDMMLGRMSLEGTMYGPKQPALLPRPGQDLAADLKAAIAKLPRDIFGAQHLPGEAPPELAQVESVKVGQLVFKDGKPAIMNPDGSFETPDWADSAAKVAQGRKYFALREATRQLIDRMLSADSTPEQVVGDRNLLNQFYDDYVKKYGPINDRKSNFLDDDVDFPLLMALEDGVQRTVTGVSRSGKPWERRVTDWVKSKIFSERTIFPRNPPVKVETVNDGYNVSMNFRGRVDPEWIAQLSGKSVEAVKADLRQTGTAFENPKTGQWEPAWRYLSGAVRTKLEEARHMAAENPEYAINVAALEKVQPDPIAFENIDFQLGSTFITPRTIQRFLQEKFGLTDAKVTFSDKTGSWFVEPGWQGVREALNTTQYGIHGFSGHDMVRLALNLQGPVVTKLEERISDSGNKYTAEVKDPKSSLEAEAKQHQVKNAFIEWAKQDPEAAREIEASYNLKANGNRIPTFEPPTWTHYPNADQGTTLRPHQMRVVTRMLQDSTLLAHAVGTGKTYAMVTAAMEMRRLGLAKKPMMVVQNATLEQFARQFKKLYPTARILVPSMKQRDAANRQRTMSRIATGDWDAVIVPQSFVNMMPDDPVRQQNYLHDQIADMKEALIKARQEEGDRSPKAADIQRRIKKLEKDFDELLSRPVDNVLKFEELGIDALFVDEAHAYKKLQFSTKMDNVKGLDTGASKRGLSMLMKVRHVQEKNQGKNVVFATGTPISNTITEVWNMMRYLRPDILKQYGMEDFDSFAANFGATRTRLEMTSVGTWDMVSRFSEYINGPELISAFRSVADVVTPEEVNLPGLPAIRGGKAQPVVVKQTPLVERYIAQLRAELQAFKEMSPKERFENSHIPLTVFTRAKKATLDMRLIDPTLPEEPGSKINVLAEKVARIYRDSTPVKGTQAIFSDLVRFTDPTTKQERWNLYQAIKEKLIAHGIPANEILIVDDSLKEAKREQAFQKLNDGEYRVAIGSTERLGTGVNFQAHAIAAHHMDAPHRPMDIEQRNGRVYRQNNENPIIDIHSYGVENTLDASLYQRLATKQKFINQILRGDIKGRRFEDAANEFSMSFEEMMAEFSGDPIAREKVLLENQYRTLEAQRQGHFQQVRQAREDAQRLKTEGIPYTENDLTRAKARADQLKTDYGDIDKVNLQFGERVFSGKKEAAAHLDERFKAAIAEAKKFALEEFEKSKQSKRDFNFQARGFKFGPLDVTLSVVAGVRNQWADEAHTKTVDVADANIYWNLKDEHWGGTVTTGDGFYKSFQSVLDRIEKEPDRINEDLTSKNRQLLQLESFVKQPFDRENEFNSVAQKYADLLKRLEKGGKAPEAEAVRKEVMALGFEVERPAKPLSVQRDQIRMLLDRIEFLQDEQDMAPGYKETVRNALQTRLREIEAEMMKQAKPEEPPEIIGMGGAIPEEFEAGKGTGTSNRNARIDAERVKRGLDPLMSRLQRAWGEVWTKAMGRIDQELDVQDNLIKELQATPRPISDEENALLLHRQVDLKNMYERSTRDMIQAKDDGRMDDAQALNVQVREWSDKLTELEQVLRDVGTKTGQALAARKMVANDDFTLGSMELRMRGAKGGDNLTPDERETLVRIADEYKKKNAELEKHLSEKDALIAQMEAQRKLRELEEETRKKAAPSSYVIKVAERWVAEWDRSGQAAKKRILERLGRTSMGLDPTLLVDLAQLGRMHIGHIGLDFARWSEKMIEDLGDFVKPHLEEVWDVVQKLVERKAEEEKDEDAREKIKNIILEPPKPKPVTPAPPPAPPVGAPTPPPRPPQRPRGPVPPPKPDRTEQIEKIKDKITDKVDRGAIDQIGPYVDKLSRIFVEDGTTDRDILVDQVHDILSDIIPDWSRRQTMDAVSHYGQFTQLQKDAVSLKLRDLKGQLQQVGKLEDMAQKIPPKKTGVERREASDEERRLIKEVNEMKKKAGFVVTDPASQLKSALQSAKTRIENLIADLKLEIKNRERIVKDRTAITPDPTLIRLRKELEDIRAEHEKVFPKKPRKLTDEQKISMANRLLDKAIAQLQADLDIGKLYREKVETKAPTSPELEAKRAKLEALKAHRDELRELAKPKVTPEERALAGIKTKLATQLLDYHRRMAEGDYTRRVRRPGPTDQQEQALRASVERVKQAWEEKVRQAERANRAPWQKWLDSFVRWERAFKLSSPVVFGKLTAAAITRGVATVAEETAGLGISLGLPKLARRAPREGGGLNAKAAAKAIAAAFNKGLDDASKTARTGKSELDIMYGQKAIDRDWANLFGQWHGALKAPVKRAEFTYSMEKRIESAIRNGQDPTNELVLQSITAQAYNDSLRSIFMQRGFTSDAFNNFVSMIERQKKYQPVGEIGARTLRFVLPVVRVPINIVAETFTGVHGTVTASVRTMFHALHGGLASVEPEVADSIMRQFKKGSIGLGLIAIGYLAADNIGGYYSGEKQKKGEPKFGGFRVFGMDVPRWMTHAPWFELMQIGATIRRVKEQHVKKTGEEKGLTEGMWAASLGLIEETPFIGQMLRFDKLFHPRERMQYWGELAKGTFIPGLVQKAADIEEYARRVAAGEQPWTDTNLPTRKPETVLQHLETGVPFLREEVPTKDEGKPYKLPK